MESNPIQQRMEEFELKYLTVLYERPLTFLLFRTPQDDFEMIEAFYDYMVGLDNEIQDVVLVFKAPLYPVQTYSKALVEELFTTTFLWNYAEKPEGMESNYVDWEMDLDVEVDKNVAALFVENLNAFCASVDLEEDSHLVCVLDYQHSEAKGILRWLKDLAQLVLHPKIRLVLADTVEQPLLDELKNVAPAETEILLHHFDLAQAIKEIATIGDPEAPDTKYRYHMVQLYEAINKQQEKEIYRHATVCLNLADRHKEKDPHWCVQKMVLYSALATFELGKKQVDAAIQYINQGIDVLREVEGVISTDWLDRLFGQAYLFRGHLFVMRKKYKEALGDFLQGETYYIHCRDYLMQIEACRLIATTSDKQGNQELRKEALNKGVRLGIHLNATLAQASTYTLLIKEVLASRYTAYISDKTLDEIVLPLLGEHYRSKFKKVKNIIENNT